MKKPTSVTHGATTWKIKWTEFLGDLNGVTDQNSSVINIATEGLSPTQQRLTFCHEDFHAGLYGSGIRAHPWWTVEVEETICLVAESIILELLTRPENKDARKWLMDM